MPSHRSNHTLAILLPHAYRGVPLAVTLNLLNAGLVVLVLEAAVARNTLVYWFIGLVAVGLLRLAIWARFRKARIDTTNARRWANRLTLSAGLAGSVWGLAGVLLFVPDNPLLYTFLLFVIGGMATGALVISSHHIQAFHAFFLTSLPPVGVHILLLGEPIHLTMAAMIAFYCMAIFMVSLRIGQTFVDIISLQERLRGIMDNVFDGIVTIGQDGRVKSTNAAAGKLFGYPPDACVGKVFFGDLVPTEYNVATEEKESTSASSWRWGVATSARELIAKRRDGATFLADIATSRMTYGGEELHIVIVRDITEQKALQVQLLQASKLATLGQMSAGIAHELNQPLNVIRMAAENALLRRQADGLDAAYTEEKLATISKQSERMGKIINHLRSFSRLDKTHTEVFDLVAVAQQAADLLRDQFDADGIELDVRLPATPLEVRGHPNQIEHALLNLLNNARDAIQERGAPPNAPAAEKGRIALEILTSGSKPPDPPATQIRLRVTDNGIGIPSANLARLFDPFFTTKAVGKGTGLGLAVSQNIVNAMGGQIVAANTAAGTCFEIKLPQADSEKNL